MTTAASSVAVTLPRLNPPSFLGPIQKPTASARKIASSGYARSVSAIHCKRIIGSASTSPSRSGGQGDDNVAPEGKQDVPTAYATPYPRDGTALFADSCT